MNCNEARALLGPYVDSELDMAHQLEIESHLANCASCARIVENGQRLRSTIQSGGLRYEPSPALEARIRPALGREAKPAARPYAARWQWIAAAAGVLLAIVLAGKLPLFRTPAADTLIAQEVLDSHLRSLMPGHLTDVESSDRHTVKPWFDGKVDFSPPVEDFAGSGFPLAGGRLDSISGRAIAALVYRRNRHLINLYIWPSPAPPSPPVTSTLQGYNLVHWTQAGSACWLISDLNLAELQQLAALVRGNGR